MRVLLLALIPSLVLADPVDGAIRRTRVNPVRVVASSAAENSDHLVSPLYGQVPEGEWHRGRGCMLTNAGAWVILDFGKELHGGVRISSYTQDGNPVRIHLRFGESVTEACSTLGERGATNHHAIRDDKVRVPSFGSRFFGDTGFRFVRIDTLDGPLQLSSVVAEEVLRDLPRLGSFRCSDERVNRVFETAVRTLHLCLQDYVWDGIKRDRLVWQGDMHPELMGTLSVFGDTAVFRRSLDYIRDITPPGKPMHGIVTYTLWWIHCQRALYDYSGDRSYLAQQGDYLRQVVDAYATHYAGDSTKGMDSFLDWPTHDNPAAEIVGARALKVQSFDDAAYLAAVLGDELTRRRAEEAAAKLRELDFDAHGNKQAAALCALAGTIPPATAYSAVLGKDGVSGVSTFYGYYMLEAMSLAGQTAAGLKTLRDYWGGMLDMGATSFWEDFDLAWTNGAFRIDERPVPGKRDIHGDFGKYCYQGFRHSLCHGWSCGPAPWLINNVLGIRPLDPGCRRISVDPDLGDLAWAEGSMALPWGGAVKVRVERDADGRQVVSASAPDGVTIVRPVTEADLLRVHEVVMTPHKVGVILEPDEGKMLDNPNVFRYGDRWWMLYIQFDKRGYETHLAESEDLVHWRKRGCVFARGAAGAWDVAQADGGPSLLDVRWNGPNTLGTFGGKYWMTYIGGAKDGYETDPLSIGVAAATTPTNAWGRARQTPVLTTADADVRPFEKRTLYKSFVVDDPDRTLGARFVMYYNAKHEKTPQYESIGMAVSDDMVSWRRYGTEPVVANGVPGEAFAISGDPMVRKVGDLWVMFYFGCGWKEGEKGAFDTFAVSRDLVHWTKWNGSPLVAPSEPWDAQHAHKPWVIRHDGVTYHYYCAVGSKGRALALATSVSPPAHVNGRDGGLWPDDKGVHVNAHGGCVLPYGGRYWWYGEHKGAGKEGNRAHGTAVRVYSSDDLEHWRDEGAALSCCDDPNADLTDGAVIERPKVLFCAKTGKFVMRFHLEIKQFGGEYGAARTGVAVADRPQGPFRYLYGARLNAGCWPQNVATSRCTRATVLRLAADGKPIYSLSGGPHERSAAMDVFARDFSGGQMTRDQTLFVDDDGTAYQISASEDNSTLQIAELTEDYLHGTGRYWRMAEKEWTEAPAVFKRDGWYYLIGSGCTGWAPNAARSYRARKITGPWERLGNPCAGVNPNNGLGPEKTWGGQSAFVFKVLGEDRQVAMFDLWYPTNPIDGRYVWREIEFEDGRPVIRWVAK